MKSFLQSKVHARAPRDASSSATMLLSAQLHAARFMVALKKRLQRGLRIHFPSNRVILQGEALHADQSHIT